MEENLSTIDFEEPSDTFFDEPSDTYYDESSDTFETEQPAELESFLTVARAAHEERIRAFWRRLGQVYDE
jgi:hypothetical protein